MGEKHRKLRVLLVEDFSDAREMYAEYLQFTGVETIQASNGEEAIARAIEARPDVIVMDLSLPVMDGWEATRRLKADERTAAIPVMALTGHAFAGIADGAAKAGCDRVVAKPCLPNELWSEIQKTLEGESVSTGSADTRRSGQHAESIEQEGSGPRAPRRGSNRRLREKAESLADKAAKKRRAGHARARRG
jgi:CheY-like chemotaxis protein